MVSLCSVLAFIPYVEATGSGSWRLITQPWWYLRVSQPVVTQFGVYRRQRTNILRIPSGYTGASQTDCSTSRLLSELPNRCHRLFPCYNVELRVKEVFLRCEENVCRIIVLKSVAHTKNVTKRTNTKYLSLSRKKKRKKQEKKESRSRYKNGCLIKNHLEKTRRIKPQWEKSTPYTVW